MPSPVRQNAALSRFELDADGGTAVLLYCLADGVMTLHHTETPAALRGRGIASRLALDAFEAARAQKLKVVPTCGFVRTTTARHSEFNDLLA